MLLEVIVQTVADAREATRGGAHRLEVVRAIRDGGLTPSIDMVRAIAAETALPLRVMVRENAGYATTRAEIPILRQAIQELTRLNVDGVVLGFARDDRLTLGDLHEVLRDGPPVRVTFHRAFDSVSDRLAAIDQLAEVPAVDRVLTDGGTGSVLERAARLRQLTERANGRLTILAGGGVDAAMLAALVSTRSVSEVHVGRLARDGDDQDAPVSAARVRHIVTQLSSS